MAASVVWRTGGLFLLRSGQRSAPKNSVFSVFSVSRFSTTSFKATDRLFTTKHEWITVEKDEGTVGITDYAQKALGDIVYAQLPDPGNEVKHEEECGALESVKAASEIYSPVSGTVTEKNTDVEEKPQLINKDCYKKGWLYKVHLADPSELDALMKEKAYEAFVKSLQDEAH